MIKLVLKRWRNLRLATKVHHLFVIVVVLLLIALVILNNRTGRPPAWVLGTVLGACVCLSGLYWLARYIQAKRIPDHQEESFFPIEERMASCSSVAGLFPQSILSMDSLQRAQSITSAPPPAYKTSISIPPSYRSSASSFKPISPHH
ncbi:hypothetical protein J3Q64DRAFT_1710077 [Phycomyces blakesleeanus]|uniref:Uncharacterized protein n=2 Tax=Phycomyces blakesleeanus TaxID=4837 RepID=A0A162ZK08_PHYB8|nr:hypothetical protein PHYBLDRAFT_63678 [Phycomyces blakesleeanus NRRL 1555(-)]OAD67321.1 hypothetical protein PHYBLDRAFT_63678 [Phycomyces blakesleeanus NRRL 1555(-)]|eukprot:XP_018285361.1 hypothetical protein PHYBLDRAFT_63678 [Phycomyces blakesleeanus NRRL 1555(-)]